MARVGVTDESHFMRDFKKSYGLTPARYRERFQNGSQDEGAHAPREVSTHARQAPPGPRGRQPEPASSVTPWTPPLLLRRASHPRQLSEPTFESRKRRELLSLLRRRHAAFAELTTEATDTIVRDMPGERAISYSPRASAPPRRPPTREAGTRQPQARARTTPAARRRPHITPQRLNPARPARADLTEALCERIGQLIVKIAILCVRARGANLRLTSFSRTPCF